MAPPLYVATTMSLDRDAGIAALNSAVDAVTGELKEKGGDVQVKVGSACGACNRPAL